MGGMVYSVREWLYAHVTLIEVRDPGVYTIRLTWITMAVSEIWGAPFPHSAICTLFESGGYVTRNNFVGNCAMLL